MLESKLIHVSKRGPWWCKYTIVNFGIGDHFLIFLLDDMVFRALYLGIDGIMAFSV